MKKEDLSNEIVKLVCDLGKGMSLQDAAEAVEEALPAFLKKAKVVDGMLAQSKG